MLRRLFRETVAPEVTGDGCEDGAGLSDGLDRVIR